MPTVNFAAVALAMVSAVSLSRAESRNEVPPRLISVSGDAEIKVVPDQVILSVAVDTSDKDLLVATQQNHDRVKRVLAVTEQFKIEPKHVQTDQVTIEPKYSDYQHSDTAHFIGYDVRKSVVICLKDLSRFEALLMALLKAGTNRVDGVQFQTTELRKHRDAARLMAVKAAREKAAAMAGELGQKLGRPRTITEGAGGVQTTGRSAYQNMSSNAGAPDSSAASGFSPGQISVTASVSISFELAD
jgi:uncharacterized protein YggE